MGSKARQRQLFEVEEVVPGPPCEGLHDYLRQFADFGAATTVEQAQTAAGSVPTYINEFWTRRQRQASRLHEVSYRACFKPQLPAFFIDRLTAPEDLVYDPFMGRGTTVLEAALRGRRVAGCDVNPLSRFLVGPRLAPPTLAEVARRLDELDLTGELAEDADLLVFFHPETLRQIQALRRHLASATDATDDWIRMVATNRLTGHSSGFFSVYTLPPNQATSPKSQARINAKRQQAPPVRDVKELILRKSKSLLSGVSQDERQRLAASEPQLMTSECKATPNLADDSVALVVTSPPFLDIVQYAQDNWLRCWFCGIDADAVQIPIQRRVEDWQEAMRQVFVELRRVLRPGGHVAFEVGEVRKGAIRLEDAVLPAAIAAGLAPELVLINAQDFTKTANCWGVANNSGGTNTNRIVLLRKQA